MLSRAWRRCWTRPSLRSAARDVDKSVMEIAIEKLACRRGVLIAGALFEPACYQVAEHLYSSFKAFVFRNSVALEFSALPSL